MTTTAPSAALIPAAPVFTNTERLALAGFLAGYSGLTREAYELDLRQYASWYHQHQLRLFQARRARAPSPGGCAPSPGSTATPWRKTCSFTPRPPMSAVRDWTMTRTPPGWT